METWTKDFCIFGPNLVIIAWTGPELLRDKQVIDTHTDTHRDAGDNNTWRPKLASGKNHTYGVNITGAFDPSGRILLA